MKEKFYNSQGYNTAHITVLANGNEVNLFYHLNDNPVQHIWQDLHRDSKHFSMGISHALSKEKLLKELNRLFFIVGEQEITENVTQDQLNKLHNKFVSQESNSKFEKEWMQINLHIHALESLVTSKFSEYDTSVVFYKDPAPESIPLTEEDKLWLTTENKWGRLLLGYGTTGKDWIDIAIDNDNLHDLNIQTYISTETIMVFNFEQPFAYADIIRFYKWASQSNFSVPLNNLNKLSLGRYLLGELIITDEFINYNPNVSDWYVPNHKCKLDWGLERIGSNPQVVGINFFNSDLYLETILKHTKND